MNLFQFIGNLESGIIYGIVAIGVCLTFKVLNFADLTVDGSFTLGASITSVMIVKGYSPLLATSLGSLGGALAGIFTGLLYTKGRIIEILTGILTMTGLYSINLRIMNSPNIGLLDQSTLFEKFSSPLILLSIVAITILIFLFILFKTNLGLSLRATGQNPQISSAFGINNHFSAIFLISLSNALVALAGSLFCQLEGFADISVGIGTVIIGIASVVIGETLQKGPSLVLRFFACIVGAIIYKMAISYALNATSLGLKSSDLNILTMILVILFMQLSFFKKRKIKRTI